MHQDHYDNVKALLDRWADRASIGGIVGRGVPNQCVGAPDARIHSIEDLEIANDKHLVSIVDTCVYELPVMERNTVLRHYGLMQFNVWQADWSRLFDQAIESMYGLLKDKMSC